MEADAESVLDLGEGERVGDVGLEREAAVNDVLDDGRPVSVVADPAAADPLDCLAACGWKAGNGDQASVEARRVERLLRLLPR